MFLAYMTAGFITFPDNRLYASRQDHWKVVLRDSGCGYPEYARAQRRFNSRHRAGTRPSRNTFGIHFTAIPDMEALVV